LALSDYNGFWKKLRLEKTIASSRKGNGLAEDEE